MSELLAAFITFFAVVDPVGTVPVYIAVTGNYDGRARRRIAFKAILIAAIVLTFFVLAGELILDALDIPLVAFQIAGGIVLFLFALSMIFGESKPDEEKKLADNATNTAVFPLAIPSIASPGAMMAAVLLTENAQFNVLEQAQTTVAMLAVLLVALVFMLAANSLHRLIGDAGASVISRVMGLILASIAATHVLAGIKEYFAP